MDICHKEVSDAIDRTKFGKAYLDVPNEALKNENATKLLHKLFSLCFSNGISPLDWSFSDIKPIPKKDKDPRDPLNNRCITIMCCIAKIYSTILNCRLQKFFEESNILVDEQNGFRAARSCMDHIFALITILRNRKAQNKSTYLCFIDFKKAFDSVNRDLLMFKIGRAGITGRMYSAIKSLFNAPKARIILNDLATDWFDCPIGVKQGDTISPTLFALYINDLATELKEAGIGIALDSDLICILLYADDIVLLANSEADLQLLLDIVHSWCSKWRLEVNLLKTNVMHVRKAGKSRTKKIFKFGNCDVTLCDQYRYLGITVNETLNVEKMVEIQCQSANRALGGLVTKMIKNGGFPLKVYKKLYESCVCSVSDYGSEVLGFKEYASLEKLHSRAIRAFLGLPKLTPIPGLRAEMGWLEPRSRTQLNMVRMYHRLVKMPEHRITKRIFLWDVNLTEVRTDLSTWSKDVKDILARNSLLGTFSLNPFNLSSILSNLRESLAVKDQEKILNNCKNLSKLRTYNLLTGNPGLRNYLEMPMPFLHRKFMAKLRLGVLPLRIETGRFETPQLESDCRICRQCSLDEVEDEQLFLLRCTKHNSRRAGLIAKVNIEYFEDLDSKQKLIYLLNNQSILKCTAKFIVESFDAGDIC